MIVIGSGKIIIKIKKFSDGGFYFLNNNKIDLLNFGIIECYYCNKILNNNYFIIIKKLKEAKLLEDNYKIRCCDCFALHNKRRNGKV